MPRDQQLPLPFPHAPGYDARDFVAAASNQAALAWLDADWPDRRLALWGAAGCGKTHLLRIWAKRSGASVLTGDTLRDLDDIPHSGGLALDDADATSEPLLLQALNTARDRGLRVLLAARTPPSRWPVQLPDLSSRLRALTAAEIAPPDDALLGTLLVRLLADRQLNVPPTVQTWLLTRLPRSPAALRDAVLQLDRVSLALGKPVSRALAAQALFPVAKADEVPMSGTGVSSRPGGFL